MTNPSEVGVVDVTTAPPATALSIQGGVSGVVVSGEVVLYGATVRNTSAANTAQVDFYDGTDANGQLIASYSLLANESARDIWGTPGLLCRRGVYANVVSGTIVGTALIGTLS